MAKFTKRAIMACLLELLKTKNIDKITVKDICEKCEINRNTFYYYFCDIYDVLNSIFLDEIEKLVSSEDISSFYDTYKRAASILIEYREAVIHVYSTKNKATVENYLEKTTNDLVGRFVRKNIGNHKLLDSDIRYITYFYSYAIIGITSKWIEDGMPPYNVDLIKRFSDTFDSTITIMIETCEKNNI